MIFHQRELRTAFEWKRLLNEYLGWSGPITHRQQTVLDLWERGEWNKPSRGDHYIASLTATVARILSSSPGQIQASQFLLTFSDGSTKVSKEEMDRRIAFSKAAWASAAGGRKRLTIVDKDGNVLKKPELPIRFTRFQGRLLPATGKEVISAYRDGIGNAGHQDDRGRVGPQGPVEGGGGRVPAYRGRCRPGIPQRPEQSNGGG